MIPVFGSCKRTKKTVEHEGDGEVSCDWSTWNGTDEPGKRKWKIWKSEDERRKSRVQHLM